MVVFASDRDIRESLHRARPYHEKVLDVLFLFEVVMVVGVVGVVVAVGVSSVEKGGG